MWRIDICSFWSLDGDTMGNRRSGLEGNLSVINVAI